MSGDADRLVELARTVLDAARGRGWHLGTAESCTGGLVGHLLTQVPGSSDVFRGGIVAYADGVKSDLLGVPPATLARHGAVSAQTARAMAHGARQRLGVEAAVAVTGIAGPSGGGPDKPVGLTYVAVADPQGDVVERHHWSGGREANKLASAEAALELLLQRARASG
jgi:nicotinamide-nucleotide amidase